MASRHLAARASRARHPAGSVTDALRRNVTVAVCLFGLGLAPAAHALQLRLAGLMGDKALIVVNGQPRVLSAGSQADGMRVLRVSVDGVEDEVAGRRERLTLQGGPASLAAQGPSGESAGGGAAVVLSPGAEGLFALEAQVQGQTVRGVVDTGASLVAVPVRLAASLGLAPTGQNRDRVFLQTANGRTQGWRVRMSMVKVGATVVREVDAVVVDADLPQVLWGNSLLKAFRVQVQGGQMTLTPVPALTLAKAP
jgi:aspartyl protease family protein